MTTLLGKCSKGLVFVVSGPAGSGKTTLIHMLVQEFPSVVASVSYTTRAPRIGEVDGIDYHFVSLEVFQDKIRAGKFLEYVQLYEDFYGTSNEWIQEQQNAGKHVVLVIDTQGAMKLQGQIPAVFVFIHPPSLEILAERLIHRQTESLAVVKKRLEWAVQELKVASFYDYQLVNEDLSVAYQGLRSIIIAETYRTPVMHKKNL